MATYGFKENTVILVIHFHALRPLGDIIGANIFSLSLKITMFYSLIMRWCNLRKVQLYIMFFLFHIALFWLSSYLALFRDEQTTIYYQVRSV